MEAAAHGKSTLGIPKSVAEDYVNADKQAGAQGDTVEVPDGKFKQKRRAKFKRKGAKGLPILSGKATESLGTTANEGY